MSGASLSSYIHPHLQIAVEVAKSANIPPGNLCVIADSVDGQVGIDDLIVKPKSLPAVERNVFASGKRRKQLALWSFSSGIPGLPKGVMISHGNLIATLCQAYEVEKHQFEEGRTRVACGVLSFYQLPLSFVVAN